jgi:hypothetical protein
VLPRTVGVTVLLIVLAQATPVQAADAWGPSAVTAVSIRSDTGSAAIVAWTLGSVPADSYNVYGVNGSSMTLLITATELTATSAQGYSTYAVSGVKNGVESELVLASVVPCIYGELTPPPPGFVVGNCGAVAHFVTGVPP